MSIPDKVLHGIDRLEPLPMTVQKLMVALNGDEVDFNEIAETIEYDGAITSNILCTANSAAFGGRNQIEHVREAVIRLGTITLLDIMLIGHLRSMHMTNSANRRSEDELWLHGATASLAVKAIIKETRNRKIPEASTIAALIHDIGKLVMVRHLNAEMRAVTEKCLRDNMSVLEAEKQLFDCTHAEVGAAIAHKWTFPEPITQAIEHHHEMPPAEPNPMLDAVIVANLVANTIAAAPSEDGFPADVDSAGSDARIGLVDGGLQRVHSQTAAWMQALKESYGLRK
jgi:putative nucleotidyltransferase with HDIG domain